MGHDIDLPNNSVKDNYANVYWPEFGFSSLENLIPGQGYQVRMYNSVDNFAFEYLWWVQRQSLRYFEMLIHKKK